MWKVILYCSCLNHVPQADRENSRFNIFGQYLVLLETIRRFVYE